MKITIFTSGSTGNPKAVTHNETDFYKPAQFLCNNWNLDKNDIIINPFPNWTIAYWAFCFFPSQLSGCELVNIKMEPFRFWDIIKEIKPTTMTLAIGTLRTLMRRKTPDLSFVKNFATGSAPVTTHDLNQMKFTGAKNIWNIYGSTECIPPVMMSNDTSFNFKKSPYYLEYDETLIVDGFDTEDIFKNNECLGRTNLHETWKS